MLSPLPSHLGSVSILVIFEDLPLIDSPDDNVVQSAWRVYP